jgi:DNA (cytosine-5)-methyltransferase 1
MNLTSPIAPRSAEVSPTSTALTSAPSPGSQRPVDVLFGGAPCQGFGMIGKRALDDPRNSLVHHFVRLAVELGASYFVFENVRDLTVGAHRKFLEEIIGEFRKNGYRVREDYRVLNAAHRGVPQNRQRLFLMGARKGFPLPEYPEAPTK